MLSLEQSKLLSAHAFLSRHLVKNPNPPQLGDYVKRLDHTSGNGEVLKILNGIACCQFGEETVCLHLDLLEKIDGDNKPEKAAALFERKK